MKDKIRDFRKPPLPLRERAGVRGIDIPSPSVKIPSEIRSSIPYSEGMHGKEILKPHFLKKRWGFSMSSSCNRRGTDFDKG